MSLTTTYGSIPATEVLIYSGNNRKFFGLIECSSDGKYVTTSVFNGGDIYTSSNYGANWTVVIPQGQPQNWTSIAMTSDGKTQYIINNVNAGSTVGNTLWCSENYGVNWSKCIDMSGGWYNIKSSENGRVYVIRNNNTLYSSANYGNTFLSIYTYSNGITDYAVSKSGQFLIGIENNSKNIFTSIDYGANWTNTIYTPSTIFSQDCSGNVRSIVTSGNGKIVVVAISAILVETISTITITKGGGVCISKDYGVTWSRTSFPSNKKWSDLAVSDNGQYIVASASISFVSPTNHNNGGVYISKDYGNTTTLLTNSETINTISVCGSKSGQFLSSSFQLIGNGPLGVGMYSCVLKNYTYSYTPIRMSYDNSFNFTFTSKLYDCSGTYYLKNNNSQILSTKVVDVSYTEEITFTGINTMSFDYGNNTLFVYKQNDNPLELTTGFDIQISDPMVINATCFLEGTKILAMDKKRILKYIPIEKLKPGMLVKTLHAGFVPIKYIGYSTIYNPGLATRVRDQLFKCTKSAYPELIEDLVLTGNHSVLVDTITDEEREQITETLGGIYVTERKYRLPAFNDQRAEPYEHRGDFRIWNLALENENYYANYGIYANGLLVETTSCRYIKEISRMTLIEKE